MPWRSGRYVVHKLTVRRICKATTNISRVLGHTKAEYLPSSALLAVIFTIRQRCHLLQIDEPPGNGRKSHGSRTTPARPENLFAGQPVTRIPTIYARHLHAVCIFRRKQATQITGSVPTGQLAFHHTAIPRKGGVDAKQVMLISRLTPALEAKPTRIAAVRTS